MERRRRGCPRREGVRGACPAPCRSHTTAQAHAHTLRRCRTRPSLPLRPRTSPPIHRRKPYRQERFLVVINPRASTPDSLAHERREPRLPKQGTRHRPRPAEPRCAAARRRATIRRSPRQPGRPSDAEKSATRHRRVSCFFWFFFFYLSAAPHPNAASTPPRKHDVAHPSTSSLSATPMSATSSIQPEGPPSVPYAQPPPHEQRAHPAQRFSLRRTRARHVRHEPHPSHASRLQPPPRRRLATFSSR